MQHHILCPKQALDIDYLQLETSSAEIESFKLALTGLLEHVTLRKTGALARNQLHDFLRLTFYDKYSIGTINKSILVIHTGSTTRSKVGVLLEVKRPANKSNMRTLNLSQKTIHKLLLSYLRERLEHNNHDLRHLIVTSVYEWFVFDALEFNRLFFRDAQLKRNFTYWSASRKASNSTDFFCQEIAAPYMAGLQESISYTYFDLRDYEKLLRNKHTEDDAELVALYKLLSPAHLLKQFYSEEGAEENSSPVCYAHIKGMREGF